MHHFRVAGVLSLGLLLAGLTARADPPKEVADDPLPKGAKVRFGISRPLIRNNAGVALVPPTFSDFLAPTTQGGTRRYQLSTGRPLEKNGLIGPGYVVVSADGKRAAVARPGLLHVVNVETGKTILAVKPPPGVIISGMPDCALSSDGQILAYGARRLNNMGVVVVLDVDRNKVQAKLETVQIPPVFVALSADGGTAVSHGPPLPAPTIPPGKATGRPVPIPLPVEASPNTARTAQVWDVGSGVELFQGRVTGMGGMVCAAAISADASLVALSAGDGPIDIWEVKTGKRLHTLLGQKSQGTRLAFAPDGKALASIGLDFRIQRWSVADGKMLDITTPPREIIVAPITGLSFRDNDNAVAWLTTAQFVVSWEAPTAKLLSPEMDHAAGIRSVAFPGDGKDPLTSGVDGKVLRWSLETGALTESIALRPPRLPGQPLIKPIVTLSEDGLRGIWLRDGAEIYDLMTGDAAFFVPPPSAPVAPTTFAMAQDGTHLVSTSRHVGSKGHGACVVWDLTRARRAGEFPIPASGNAGAPAATLSPDNTRVVIAIAGADEANRPILRFAGFDVATGKKLAELEDSDVSGTVAIIAANSTTAIVSSTSGRLWSVNYLSGEIEDNFDQLDPRGEPPLYGQLAVSPDGKRFAVGAVDQPFRTYATRVYDLETRKLLHTFVGHVGPISTMRFSRDGAYLATGSQDSSVIVWDLTKIGEDR